MISYFLHNFVLDSVTYTPVKQLRRCRKTPMSTERRLCYNSEICGDIKAITQLILCTNSLPQRGSHQKEQLKVTSVQQPFHGIPTLGGERGIQISGQIKI